jgi:AcrR family transcriptional regulator
MRPKGRRRRTNAEWSAETRSSLLAAARRAFELDGYDSASLESIVSAAHLTKGAVYHHYKDKRALFRAVFELVERELVVAIERVAFSQASAYEGVVMGCGAFLDAVLKEGVARIILIDGPRVLGWKSWREIDAETGGRSLREGLEAAMKAGQITRLNTDALATLISGALNEAALMCAEAPDSPHLRRAVNKSLRRLLEGLRVAEAPKSGRAVRSRMT